MSDQNQKLPPSGFFGRVDINSDDKRTKVGLGETAGANVINMAPAGPPVVTKKAVVGGTYTGSNKENWEDDKSLKDKVNEGLKNMGDKIKNVFVSDEPKVNDDKLRKDIKDDLAGAQRKIGKTQEEFEKEADKYESQVKKLAAKGEEKLDKAKKDIAQDINAMHDKFGKAQKDIEANLKGGGKDLSKKIDQDIHRAEDKLGAMKQDLKDQAHKVGAQVDQGVKKAGDKLHEMKQDVHKNLQNAQSKLEKAKYDFPPKDLSHNVGAPYDHGIQEADTKFGKVQDDFHTGINQAQDKLDKAKHDAAVKLDQGVMKADAGLTKAKHDLHQGLDKARENLDKAQKDLQQDMKKHSDKVAGELDKTGDKLYNIPEKKWQEPTGRFDQDAKKYDYAGAAPVKNMDQWNEAQGHWDDLKKNTAHYPDQAPTGIDTSVNQIESNITAAKHDLGRQLNKDKDLGAVMKDKIDSVSHGVSYQDAARNKADALKDAQKGYHDPMVARAGDHLEQAQRGGPIGAAAAMSSGWHAPAAGPIPDKRTPYDYADFPECPVPGYEKDTDAYKAKITTAKHCEVMKDPLKKDVYVLEKDEYIPSMKEAFYHDPALKEKKEGVLVDTYKMDRARADVQYPGLTKTPAATVLPKTDVKYGVTTICCPNCKDTINSSTVCEIVEKNQGLLKNEVDLKNVSLNLDSRCSACNLVLPKDTVFAILKSHQPELVSSKKDMKGDLEGIAGKKTVLTQTEMPVKDTIKF